MQGNFSSEITEQALAGINIPPCPGSITAILREAAHPDVDFNHIAQLISRDAGLVAPLLKLANSPFVGLRTKVNSVLQAINVLGMKNTINLVHNIALRQSMGGSPKFEKFWERSSMNACVAEKLATHFPTVSRDDAYLAALFHDCGIPILMMKFEDYRDRVSTGTREGHPICHIENTHFSTTHPVVGNMLTRHWQLPGHISKAILLHHDLEVYTQTEMHDLHVRDLIGIVHMAECVVEEYLDAGAKEWHKFSAAVLEHFELSHKEFSEIKGDMLALLGGA